MLPVCPVKVSVPELAVAQTLVLPVIVPATVLFDTVIITTDELTGLQVPVCTTAQY